MEIDPVGGVKSGVSGSGPSAAAARRRTPGRWRRIPRAIGPSENIGMARLEIDPVGGGAGVTSGASGSGPSATAATPRTAGPSEDLRRIPRAIDPPEKVGMARLPELAQMRAEPWKSWVGPLNLEGAKKIAPTSRAETSASTGRLQETGVDQKIRLPTVRFEIVSDPNNPSNYTTVLVEKKFPPIVRAEIGADEKITSTLSDQKYHPSPSTGLLQERRPPILEMDLKVVVKGSRECEEMEERSKKFMLEQAMRLEQEAEEGPCDTEEDKAEFRALKRMYAAECRRVATTKPVFIYKPPSDTIEEHLTAEEMERQANISGWPVCSQAQHFATLALEWYNSTKKTHKFEIAKVLLSKCFTDVDSPT